MPYIRGIPFSQRDTKFSVFASRDSNCNFAVVGRDRLGNPAEIGNGIVVDPDPIVDVAADYSFDVEIIAERQRGHKNGYFRGQFGITPVMKAQRFPGEVQFQIHTGKPLNVEGDLGAVKPGGITPTILAVTQRFLTVHRADCVVLLPQVL